MKSILQSEKVCLLTGRTDNLHEHHIYHGRGIRKISENNGFKVWLTGEWHNQDSRKDVHSNRWLDLYLKRLCQEFYEKTHTNTEFMTLIGKNYIYDEEELAWILEMASDQLSHVDILSRLNGWKSDLDPNWLF